ncbi:MAG: LacI family transcriptional regulator [Phycisphaerales bacterium]|nr:LacI family transcriptional regulator [Phycisphaerales bacterium]
MSIVEVARIAGTSHSTVSRVINKRPGVAPRTIEAVQRAMRELGYVPPLNRRGPKLAGWRRMATGSIGLLMVGTDAMFARAPVTAAVFHAVEKALTEHGFNLIVGQVGAEGRLPPDVAKGQIDGLLLHGYAPPAKLREHLATNPSVWLLSQRSTRGYWGDRVCPDNEVIGRLAAEHLLALGHRHIAYLYFSPTHMGFRSRAEAFAETIEEFGATCEMIAEDPSSRRPSRREDFGDSQTEHVVRRLLAMNPRPTGIFVPRDRLTVKVYRAMRDLGVEPGRDIEVISCDNEPILEALDPRPTSIDVRPELIGRRAVEQLVWRMQHPDEPTRAIVTIEPMLVESDEPRRLNVSSDWSEDA